MHVQFHTRETSTQTDPDVAIQMESQLLILPEAECLRSVTHLLQIVAAHSSSHMSVTVPDDFLDLSLRAMSHLKRVGRSTVVYGLVRGLGEMRADQSDSRLPVLRMPMGLLEYVVSFYSSETLNQVNVIVTLSPRYVCISHTFAFIVLLNYIGCFLPP